jgi:sRNA-binding regulator protein Hfq
MLISETWYNSTQIVYKHAISTIISMEAVQLFDPDAER